MDDVRKAGWLIPPDPELDLDGDGETVDRTDSLLRMLYRSSAERDILDAAGLTEDPDLLYMLGCAYNSLRHYARVAEAVIARHEGSVKTEPFRLLHRQLSGMVLRFSSYASSRPDQPCGAFKAHQLNQVLLPLRALLEEDGLCASFPSLVPVSETGEHTNSDVLFILQNYLDVCADFASRHFDGVAPVNPPLTKTYRPRIIELLILDFCMDGPKSVREIGDSLGYRDKKTVRKYLDPLISAGCIERTVPDRICSRNQKYVTVKFK